MKENQVITQNLREVLKTIMQREIEEIPDLLKDLEPKDRLNLIIRLMPFVFPKVESIHQSSGEPLNLR